MRHRNDTGSSIATIVPSMSLILYQRSKVLDFFVVRVPWQGIPQFLVFVHAVNLLKSFKKIESNSSEGTFWIS